MQNDNAKFKKDFKDRLCRFALRLIACDFELCILNFYD